MKRRAIIAALVVTVGVGVYVAWTPVQIWYHTGSLDRLHAEIYSAPSAHTPDGLVAYGSGDQFEREDRHKNRLAALGYFFHERYEMENVPDTGETHSALWKLVQQHFPDRRYPILSYPDNVLEVWDVAEDKPKWDTFAEKYNVPDFMDRYGSPTTGQQNRNRASGDEPTTSAILATDVTKAMVGNWGTDGEPVLIISLDGDRVVISAPPNDAWRMDIHDAKIVKDSIHFVQKNYLRSGEAHPFNGVPCESVVQLTGGDTLRLTVTTEHLAEPQIEVLTRLK